MDGWMDVQTKDLQQGYCRGHLWDKCGNEEKFCKITAVITECDFASSNLFVFLTLSANFDTKFKQLRRSLKPGIEMHLFL